MTRARVRWWVVSIGLMVVVATLYAQTVRFDSLDFDDQEYVYANPAVLSGLTGHGVIWALTVFHSANWHPLTWMSHMLDVQLLGPNPGPHHLVNAALHGANVVLLFTILNAATSAFWPSAMVAALFAVHPLNVESVAWISQRKGVLSTLFLLLAIGSYLRFASQGGVGRGLAVVALVALGLLTKPMLVSAPLLFLVLDFWPLQRFESFWGGRRLLLEKVPLLLLVGASSAVTVISQARWNALGEVATFRLGERVANALVSCVSYLRDAVWPVALACFYPHPASTGGSTGLPAAVGAAALLAAITALVWAARRSRPWLLFGWAWYLIALAPVIGLVQVGMQARADRYTYVPMIGLFVAVVWEVAARTREHAFSKRIAGGIGVLVLAAFAVLAFVQVGTWRDGGTLNSHALRVTRNNWLASNNLGTFWLSRHEPGRALAAFREAERMRPNYEDAYYNEGVALSALSRHAEAVHAYRESLRLDPSNTDAWVNLGFALLSLRRVAEGLQAYEMALSQRENDAMALDGAAVARLTLGDSAGAFQYLARLERVDSGRAMRLRRDLGLAR